MATKTNKRNTLTRDEWMTALINRKPKGPYKAFSSRLQLTPDLKEIFDKATCWFFFPSEVQPYRFVVVDELNNSFTMWSFENDKSSAHSFRLLNALVRARKKMVLDDEERERLTGLKLYKPQETQPTPSEDFQQVTDLGAGEPTPAETLTEEPASDQPLDIHGQLGFSPQTFVGFVPCDGRRVSKPEGYHQLYSNENINRIPVDNLRGHPQSAVLEMMIQLVDDAFDYMNLTLTRLATPALVAHVVSLLDMRVCRRVSDELEDFEEADLTKLYLAISSRYAEATDQGIVPLDILDEFMQHRHVTLVEFFQSLRLFTTGPREQNERRSRRSRNAEVEQPRPIPRVMENRRGGRHTREETNPFSRGRLTRHDHYEDDERPASRPQRDYR